jgi:predicted RNA-binding protein with PIN domain
MSLHYIVDGYNVLMRSGLFDRKRLQDARAAFVAYLEHHRPHGSCRNKLTIVFDGKAEVAGLAECAIMGVLFSAGESADEKIKEMVERSPRPKDIVVVTDDRELGFFVRRCGACLMGSRDFLGKTSVKKKASPARGPDVVEREKITEELGRVWLRKT